MTTISDIVAAFAPEYLKRFPNLPVSHQQVLSAILNCKTGHYGHSLYACAYSGDCCHLIRCKAAMHSGGRLPPNPVQSCHRFQTKAATPSERSDAWLD